MLLQLPLKCSSQLQHEGVEVLFSMQFIDHTTSQLPHLFTRFRALGVLGPPPGFGGWHRTNGLGRGRERMASNPAEGVALLLDQAQHLQDFAALVDPSLDGIWVEIGVLALFDH